MTEPKPALAKALVAAHAEIQNVKLNKVNPFFKSKYADLAAVIAGSRDILAKHKLAIYQTGDTVDERGFITVITTLLHESGESINGSMSCKPKSLDPQQIGSAITYLRRYSLSAMLGVASEEDDDGNSQAPEKKTEAYISLTPKQIGRLYAIATTVGVSQKAVKEAVMTYYKKNEPKDMTKDQYDELIKKLEDKDKKK